MDVAPTKDISSRGSIDDSRQDQLFDQLVGQCLVLRIDSTNNSGSKNTLYPHKSPLSTSVYMLCTPIHVVLGLGPISCPNPRQCDRLKCQLTEFTLMLRVPKWQRFCCLCRVKLDGSMSEIIYQLSRLVA